jgi:hypothetical protein
MKLTVTKKQELSDYGPTLVIGFKANVSDEEHQILKRYGKLNSTVGQVREVCGGVSLARLISEGASFRTRSLIEVQMVEEQVKQDCQEIADFVQAVSSYDGSYTYELVPTADTQGHSGSGSVPALKELVSLRQAQQYAVQELKEIRKSLRSLQTSLGLILIIALIFEVLSSCSRYRF